MLVKPKQETSDQETDFYKKICPTYQLFSSLHVVFFIIVFFRLDLDFFLVIFPSFFAVGGLGD